jgi:polyketide biosynthesis enoyl-CoA hydratase PksH
MAYRTIRVTHEGPVCHIQIDRPEANNTINDELVAECNEVLSDCEESASVVVLSGSAEVFCLGADFAEIAAGAGRGVSPEDLYNLWLRLASGPYITISHVCGKANAGGVGFAAASDIVLAGESAQFSLSELLFGLYPACVLPFLIRRVGYQRAHYLTLTSQPISARQACEWGLADACDPLSDGLLRRHLQRLRRLSKAAIGRYKSYMGSINAPLRELRSPAAAANREMFADAGNLVGIIRYVEEGLFPWEAPKQRVASASG